VAQGSSAAAMESYFIREPSEAKKDCAEKLQPLSSVQRIKVVREYTDPTWYQVPSSFHVQRPSFVGFNSIH
jgi:hypothetical protein